jgi:SOS response regulatory protein OraA/RecX
VNGLFGDDAETVTRLTPDKSSPLWVHVVVGARRAAKVPAAKLDVLGLAVGTAWSTNLAERSAVAAQVLKAKLKAVALLKLRARSSAEVVGRLVRQGFSRPASDLAVAELVQEGLLDDEALAQSRAEGSLSKGMASGAVQEELSRSGLAQTQAAGAIAEIAGSGDELARAIEQARNRAARIPESLGASVRYRRVLTALARMGYDEEVAREAAAKALGIGPDDSAQTIT